MSWSRISIVVAAVSTAMFLGTGVASAQAVKLQFNNGRVTLTAQNASIRTILSEWSRIGGTHIVNGERVAGAPLTLELTNVPERQALDIILRSVSGYMAGPRGATAAGASAYDRIMILPTSSAAATAPRPTQPNPQFGTPQPSFSPPPFDPNDPEENPPNDIPPPEAVNDGAPFQRGRPFQRNGRVPPGIVQAQPFPPTTQPDPDDIPQEAPANAPTNPFGIAPGSSRPGVVTPVPQAPRPNQRPNDPEP